MHSRTAVYFRSRCSLSLCISPSLENVYFPCTHYTYSRSYHNQFASPSCLGLFAVPSCPDQSPLQGGHLLSDDYLFRGDIFSRTAVPVIISLHSIVQACRSHKRRDCIATVIAPQANSLLNWLGRRSTMQRKQRFNWRGQPIYSALQGGI